MPAEPEKPDCIYCGDGKQVEILVDTKLRWSCFCGGCGKVFSLRKPLAVQMREHDARLKAGGL